MNLFSGFYLSTLMICFSLVANGQDMLPTYHDNSDWLIESDSSNSDRKEATYKLDLIRVDGNQFVDEKNEEIIFKGLSISDPDKIVTDGHWGKKHFEVVKSWGVNLVRIPIHPAALKRRGKDDYLKLIDEAVEWCTELKMYVIIDWHSIGNLNMELFQSDNYETTLRETYKFWKDIASRYQDNSTVAFYEIFNEPTVYNGTLGKCTWAEWKTIAENIIDIIYAHDKKVIPLVGGFDWAYDLRDVKYHPIEREGIAYVAHPYPGKCTPPREPHWEEHFGFLSDQFPILATELGYYLEGKDPHLTDDGTYRESIIKYFDKKGISWCAWVFDPRWAPQMIKNYDYEPTHSGAFFRDVMLGKYEFGQEKE